MRCASAMGPLLKQHVVDTRDGSLVKHISKNGKTGPNRERQGGVLQATWKIGEARACVCAPM
eukprot:1139963-Pelagomonas_calceolata.AAC.2